MVYVWWQLVCLELYRFSVLANCFFNASISSRSVGAAAAADAAASSCAAREEASSTP